MNLYKYYLLICLTLLLTDTYGRNFNNTDTSKIIVGANQTEFYLPLLQGKRVALVANQSSNINQTHLADSMLGAGITLELVFSPEHGFRGNADAGQYIANEKDIKTGLPIISLYGKHKKPTPSDMHGIDIVVFDIQDVGARFYTYISTLHYIMETCAELNLPLLVLDRPNPNGHYVDGPVLDTTASSFVGMHPVPIVHGMTIGEYALMINGEAWLANHINCNLMVLPCKNYTHNTPYQLPVKPSPNLPNIQSVLLYPSLALFEGTIMSVGRGSAFPFQVYGHPNYNDGSFEYTPQSVAGAKHPKYKNEVCKGFDLQSITIDELYAKPRINLDYLISSYNYFKLEPGFFNSFFYRLAGTHLLQQQIENGLSEEEIRASWQNDLEKFREIRSNYLLYDDFKH